MSMGVCKELSLVQEITDNTVWNIQFGDHF